VLSVETQINGVVEELVIVAVGNSHRYRKRINDKRL
jgi:hypothetical protein